MALTFRRNKSVPLTFEELDGNFDDVNGRVTTIEGAYVTSVNGFDTAVTLGSDNITEGSTNLYYTEARFNTSLASKTTNNLTEGSSNLYFTNARVTSAVGVISVDSFSDVVTTGGDTPSTSDVLTWDGTIWKPVAPPGASGGEANLGANIGTGINLYKQKTGVNLELYTIRTSDTNIDIVQNTGNNTVDLSWAPSADVDLLTNKITNLGTPTNVNDAANKAYVDGLAGSGTLAITDDTDGAVNISIDLASETLQIQGTANQISSNVSGNAVTLSLPSSISVNAATATTLESARAIGITGAVVGTANFDGSAGISISTAYSGGLTLGTDTTGSYVATVTGGSGITVTGGGAGEGTTPSIALDTSGSPTFTNLTLSGNLTVNGTTTTIDTTNTVVSDSLIELSSGTTGTPGNDAGLVIERGDGDNVFIGWDESSDKVIVGTGTFTGANTGNLTVTLGTMLAGTFEAGNLTITGNTISSSTGDILIAPTADVDVNSNVIKNVGTPTADGHAATKGYVDTALSAFGGSFNISSDSGSGVITTGSDTLIVTGGTGIDTSITGDSVTVAFNGTGMTSENATKSVTVQITEEASSAAAHNIHFGSASSGYDGVNTHSSVLYYVPSTETLAVTNTTTVSSSAQYADLAEKYTADNEYAPGTVMEIGGDAETTAWVGSRWVAGVISTNPAFVMNSELDGPAVALSGRVPVRVTGSINKGQAVFAYANGVASGDGSGPLVGIAIETSTDTNEKLVECMLKV